jgi:hypothetical protein
LSNVIVPKELSVVPQPPPQPVENVLLSDDFSDPSSGWEHLEEKGHFTMGYWEHHYRIALSDTYPHARVISQGFFENFCVEVDVQKISGAEFGLIGVVGRQTDQGYYSFEFDYRGHCGIFIADSNRNANLLVKAQPNPTPMDPLGIYHIKGICDHDNLTLVLNDQVMAHVKNSTHRKLGGAGFTVNPGKPGNGMDVLFSNFAVKGL